MYFIHVYRSIKFSSYLYLYGLLYGYIIYCEQIRVFKAGNRLNTSAWNNKIGLGCYFVGCVPK